jgi:hypothetical protein
VPGSDAVFGFAKHPTDGSHHHGVMRDSEQLVDAFLVNANANAMPSNRAFGPNDPRVNAECRDLIPWVGGPGDDSPCHAGTGCDSVDAISKAQ